MKKFLRVLLKILSCLAPFSVTAIGPFVYLFAETIFPDSWPASSIFDKSRLFLTPTAIVILTVIVIINLISMLLLIGLGSKLEWQINCYDMVIKGRIYDVSSSQPLRLRPPTILYTVALVVYAVPTLIHRVALTTYLQQYLFYPIVLICFVIQLLIVGGLIYITIRLRHTNDPVSYNLSVYDTYKKCEKSFTGKCRLCDLKRKVEHIENSVLLYGFWESVQSPRQ